ncbi:hypothetical protein Tco_1464995 [Tanacetum coccineum]
MHTVAGDDVKGIKRRRRDLHSNGIRNFATTIGLKTLLATTIDILVLSQVSFEKTIVLVSIAVICPRKRGAKLVKEISLPQDVPSTSDCHLIKLENQVQHLMEAHLAPMQPTPVNKITTSCEIYSGPHNTQYCMKDLEQAFVEYASSRTDKAGGDDGDVMFIEIVKKNDDSRKDEPEAGGLELEYFDIFPTRSELVYHKYLICGLIPSIFLRNLIITEGYPSNLKIPCNIGHAHVEKAYIDLNSPLNIMTRMMYNWIMRRKLDPRENSDKGVSNFTGRIKGMHVFIGNFTYAMDFMIVKDISSIIDPRLSQVVIFDEKKLGSS